MRFKRSGVVMVLGCGVGREVGQELLTLGLLDRGIGNRGQVRVCVSVYRYDHEIGSGRRVGGEVKGRLPVGDSLVLHRCKLRSIADLIIKHKYG